MMFLDGNGLGGADMLRGGGLVLPTVLPLPWTLVLGFHNSVLLLAFLKKSSWLMLPLGRLPLPLRPRGSGRAFVFVADEPPSSSNVYDVLLSLLVSNFEMPSLDLDFFMKTKRSRIRCIILLLNTQYGFNGFLNSFNTDNSKKKRRTMVPNGGISSSSMIILQSANTLYPSLPLDKYCLVHNVNIACSPCSTKERPRTNTLSLTTRLPEGAVVKKSNDTPETQGKRPSKAGHCDTPFSNTCNN